MKFNLNVMQILDEAIAHFSKPESRVAFDLVKKRCDYGSRQNPNNRCAVGIFDKEDLLTQCTQSVHTMVHEEEYLSLLAKVFGVPSLTPDDITFLARLQECHDDTVFSVNADGNFRFFKNDDDDDLAIVKPIVVKNLQNLRLRIENRNPISLKCIF